MDVDILYEEVVIDGQLTFIITPTRIFAKTPLQTNLIVYNNGNYKRRWEKLPDYIRSGKIKTISDLINYNKPTIGGITQIQGLILVPTRLERYVNL